MASTDQTVSGVAGRYANALFELAREEKSIDRVAKDLATVQAHLEGSDDLQRLFTQPSFRAEDQGAVVADLGKKMGLSALTGNFLQTLAKNRRLAAAADAIAAFQTLVASARGEVTAEVTSAEKLSAKQVSDLKAALKSALGQEANISLAVDPAILGGLIIKVGSRMLDNSLKTKLQNLKIAMKGTG